MKKYIYYYILIEYTSSCYPGSPKEFSSRYVEYYSYKNMITEYQNMINRYTNKCRYFGYKKKRHYYEI